jgi:hypothetical protein
MRLPTSSLVAVLLAMTAQEVAAQAQGAPASLSTLSGFVAADPNSLRPLPGLAGAATPPPAAAVAVATPPAAVAAPPAAVQAPPAAIQAPPANNVADVQAGGLAGLGGFEAPTGALRPLPGLAGGVC